MQKILIVGDLFPVPSNFDRFSAGDTDSLYGEKICSLFQSADYRICNLEGALTDRPGSLLTLVSLRDCPISTPGAQIEIKCS